MTNPVLGLHHIALRTPDVDRTVGFYEALGYTRVHGWSLPRINLSRAEMLQSPDRHSWVEVFDPDADVPMEGARARGPVATGALVHLCLVVADLQAAVDIAVAAGGRLRIAPEVLHLGTPPVAINNAIIDGTAGEVIELLEPARFPGDRDPAS